MSAVLSILEILSYWEKLFYSKWNTEFNNTQVGGYNISATEENI